MIILNIHHQHTICDRLPKWAHYFLFQFLPRWIFIQGPVKFESKKPKISISETITNPVLALPGIETRCVSRRKPSHKPSLLACITGSAGHELQAACCEITNIAAFLTARKESRKSINEWHIISAVLDRILLIVFSITLLMGSFYFYSEVGRNPIPAHPFKNGKNEVYTAEDLEYVGCNEYHEATDLTLSSCEIALALLG